MALDRFRKLVECLSTLQPESGKCDCSVAINELDCLAEQAVEGVDIHSILPVVAAHIDCCPDCREEFEALVAVVRAVQDEDTTTQSG